MESTFSKINIEGPQTKFWENQSWDVQSSVMNTGANEVVGRGIKKISLVKNLTRSATIWKAPLRPIRTGPTLRITYAKIFRSLNAINNKNNIESRQTNNPVSLIAFIWVKWRVLRKGSLDGKLGLTELVKLVSQLTKEQRLSIQK